MSAGSVTRLIKKKNCDGPARLPLRSLSTTRPVSLVQRVSMTRKELLSAAITKLEEASRLLTSAGENSLAKDAEELAEWVDFSLPLASKPAA